MFVASNKDGDVLRDDFDQYLYPRGDTISCSEEKKGRENGDRRGEKKARKKEEEREFGMRARRRAIREELSLFSHQNDDFFFLQSSDLKTLGQAPTTSSEGNAALGALNTLFVLCFGFLWLLNAPLEGDQRWGCGHTCFLAGCSTSLRYSRQTLQPAHRRDPREDPLAMPQPLTPAGQSSHALH